MKSKCVVHMGKSKVGKKEYDIFSFIIIYAKAKGNELAMTNRFAIVFLLVAALMCFCALFENAWACNPVRCHGTCVKTGRTYGACRGAFCICYN